VTTSVDERSDNAYPSTPSSVLRLSGQHGQ
jgi:hypothetical protein